MARYVCPDCKTRSHNLPTEAEARWLLRDHQRYTCPARPGPAGSGQSTTRRRGRR